MRILHWHVHGSWTTSFVHGPHTYLLPVLPDRGPDGRGRARTWDWPASAVELTPARLRDSDIDVVVLQRPEELELCERWTGRRPGRDVPAVFVEHNAPQGRVNELRHPLADRDDVTLVHVTHFNALFWDAGTTPITVIEHGIADPGHRWTGELPHAAVVVNEPVRRGRVAGTDLLPRVAGAAPLELFGMGVAPLGGEAWCAAAHEDLPQERMHDEIARRAVYLHPFRWTSLGLALIEAMHLGMPIVALSTTEAPEAVPPEAGVVSNRIDTLREGLRRFTSDHEAAAAAGKAAREHALGRHGLRRFLDDWDRLLEEVTSR
ncbi:MAG TPA: glycosyltransferase [Egibacteraceae bacterium]|nr:glycosyltransferase [Egibacteraceae bacterium]